MYFIPLNQAESVELVIHALRAAAGEADCTMCPAYKVCMKQCLTIGTAVARMWQAGVIPSDDEAAEPVPTPEPEPPKSTGGGPRLTVVK